MSRKKITDLTEATTAKTDHYIPVDHETDGTQKMSMSTLVEAVNEAAQGEGLTQTEKNLILDLFEKAAYADDDASTKYEALKTLWTGYSVTWNGSGFSKSNNASGVTAGDTFTSTIVANTGKTIESVTVTMGGTTVTGAYSSGTVTIPNVTGDIVITVETSQITVSSISAVYTQTGTVYDTDTLDSLKNDLVVTATFADSSTGVIPSTDYTLSGTLTVGTSTITVSYGGKTTTFNVTVTASPSYVSSGLFAHWDAIDNQATGTHDSNATTWVDLVNGYTWTAEKTDGTQWWSWGNNGLVFNPSVSGGTIESGYGKNTFLCPRPGTGLRTLEVVFTPESYAMCVGEFTSDITGITDSTTQTIGLLASDNTFIIYGSQNGYSATNLTYIKSISGTYGSTYAPVKAYMNGEEVTTQGASHSFRYHQDSKMVLGSQNNNTGSRSYSFKGTIHAIRFYDRELTAEEIAQNYATDVARFGLGA